MPSSQTPRQLAVAEWLAASQFATSRHVEDDPRYRRAIRRFLARLQRYRTVDELVSAYLGHEPDDELTAICKLPHKQWLSFQAVAGRAYWQRFYNELFQEELRSPGGASMGGGPANRTTDS